MTEIESAAKALGDALESPAELVKPFFRLGFKFNKKQKKEIRLLSVNGNYILYYLSLIPFLTAPIYLICRKRFNTMLKMQKYILNKIESEKNDIR